MEITEVRIKLMEKSDDRLQAFCSVTFDDGFVVRDLKIIEGSNGPFVAMPSRKLTSHCPQCGCKNHLRAAYCNQCGLRLKDDRAIRDQEGRAKLYADIAHPINSTCREMIQSRVVAEFAAEKDRAQQPGYISRYDDDYDDFLAEARGGGEIRQTTTTPQSPAPASPPPTPTPQHKHVEPAESQPRGPHKTPSQKPASQSSESQSSESQSPASDERSDDQFGAGIL